MNPARKKAYIELLIVAAIWGIASPVIKFTLGGLDSVTFLTYRFGISTILAIILLVLLKSHFPKDKKIFFKLLAFGFLNSTVALGFLFFGLENTTVLDSSLITLANPLLVSVAGVLFLKEHITKREKTGMAVALLGTALIVIEPLMQNGNGVIRLSGNIMIVGYLISAAWSAVLAKEILRAGVKPIVMTNISFIIGFLSFLPVALIKNPGALGSIPSIPIPYHLGVFYMAILSGSLAYYLYNKAQKTIEIGEASVFAYLYPLFSTPLAVIWLGEKITPIFIVGAVIIAFGVFLAEVKSSKALKARL